MKNIYKLVNSLIEYSMEKNFIYSEDKLFVQNRISNFLGIDAEKLIGVNSYKCNNIGNLLSEITQWAYDNQKIESVKMPYSELFETELMSILVPFPSTVNNLFWEKYKKSYLEATDWYFDFSKSTDYIKTNRIAQNITWNHKTNFADMTITINLSKPEKDPMAIAAALKLKQTKYPKCLLCKENVGFAGHLNHPARQTHRVVDLKLSGENWFIQYSPYMYFNEHMIVINEFHTDMKINEKTFVRLCDFIDYFPHYFVGSNADIPIVGGSMLTHDHYQAGRHIMPIDSAKTYIDYKNELFENVSVVWLNWPLTTFRLRSKNREDLINACSSLNKFWQKYEDKANNLVPFTENTRHHTVTPIMRKRDNEYEIDIVLRSNLTNEEYPDGIFHPHPEIHPVKKENIGLIEVMGYAILPARLKQTISDLSRGLENNLDFSEIAEFSEGFEKIYRDLQDKYVGKSATDLVKKEIGDTFAKGLSHCGVIKNDKNGEKVMDRFISEFREQLK